MGVKNFLRAGVFSVCFANACAMQAPQEIWAIIHGTWAHDESWWNIGGDFFCALQKAVASSGAKVLPFGWDGKNTEKSRKAAALALANYLSCFDRQRPINIVAHSHGVNIALGACQLLAQKQPLRKIKALYALGAPVCEEQYCPNMDVIEVLYNLFSFNDTVQNIFDYKRVFKYQPGIFNLRVLVDGQAPTHTTLHSPIVAAWLPTLEQVPCCNQGLVKFYSAKVPKIVFDFEFEKLLAADKPINFPALLIDPRTMVNFYKIK